MQVSTQSRRMVRLQNILFVILFLSVMALLAWLSNQYRFDADWTASGRNTLSDASISLLSQIDGPVNVTVYARESALVRPQLSEFLGKYRRYKQDFIYQFVNPDLVPDKVRELGITMDGEMVIEIRGRRENLQDPREQALTNVLQRLARSAERSIIFLQGHGERAPQGGERDSLGQWTQQLKNKGFEISTSNLGIDHMLPENTSVLVIAGPRTDYLPGEVAIIKGYLESGGNLLWLTDPGSSRGLDGLAEYLNISVVPGVIVDPNVSEVGLMLFGTNDPRVALVASYGPHPLVRGFNLNTLYHVAGAFSIDNGGDWKGEGFLSTLSNTWSEVGEVAGTITYDPGLDVDGPLHIGVVLARNSPAAPKSNSTAALAEEVETKTENVGQQRVIVVGDSDFVSNSFLGTGGNLDMAMRIMNWLAQDDSFINIPARTASDVYLDLTGWKSAVIAFGALIVMPLALFGAGFIIWYRRRRR